MLAIAIHSEYKMDIDISKAIQMLVIHELEEVIIGDITPFDNVTQQQKEENRFLDYSIGDGGESHENTE